MLSATFFGLTPDTVTSAFGAQIGPTGEVSRYSLIGGTP
jgi:hypothetical protein